MSTARQLTYAVEAYNLSHGSENKIHDDSIAQKLGFQGGLVPGVEVFAYATHPALERYGPAFLEHGHIACRFLKPVYDGHTATVTAIEQDSGLEILIESDGVHCATGHAAPDRADMAVPTISDNDIAPPPTTRPPADETSLAVDRTLATHPAELTRDWLTTYLADVRETNPLYAEAGYAHPGLLLRLCNSLLRENVQLQPWIHTASRLNFHALARVGDTLSARARVAANYERKGHRLVDLDCLVLANDQTPVAHVLHTAIYQLRHLAA